MPGVRALVLSTRNTAPLSSSRSPATSHLRPDLERVGLLRVDRGVRGAVGQAFERRVERGAVGRVDAALCTGL